MKIPKLKEGDLVKVWWHDAFVLPSPWNDEVDLSEEYEVVSVGFWIGTGRKYFKICADVAAGACGRVMSIPVGMIGKVKKVKK